MDLNKYFEDMGFKETEIARQIEQLVEVCVLMPANNCMICGFEGEKPCELAPSQNVEKSFDEFEEIARREAGRGNAVFILIRANGRLFLDVGAPYERWARAYKMPGHDVFVLEKQD